MSPFRRVAIFVLAAAALLCGGGVALATWVWSNTSIDTAGQVDFARPVAIPPLARSHLDDQGRRVFDLRAGAGRHDFGNGPVSTWGFNGSYLGPTLRAARGEQVVVNVQNGLDQETTVHWHGMHLPARMDGGPHQPIAAGATWSPTWRIDQPATTLWYHPHLHGATAEHVYRGLAGMFIVDDPATDAPALPHTYGVDDIPVIVQDKRFDGDRLSERGSMLGGVGILGDTVVVNGTAGPYLDVTTQRVRLRLLNASNARTYEFGLDDDRPFDLVGTDGGLLPAPASLRRLPMAPGERAEIVVTMRPGERAVLRSAPHDLGGGGLADRFVGARDALDIMELRAAPTLAPSPPVPDHLTDVPRLTAEGAANERTFQLADHRINGRTMEMDRIDATVTKGTTEIWRVSSLDGTPHSFHIHDVQFQVLSVNGGAPSPELSGWKDTVFLRANAEYELAVPFTDYADPNSPYMFHCHMLMHEDRGMMGQFVVVEPGQRAGTPPSHAGHDAAGGPSPAAGGHDHG